MRCNNCGWENPDTNSHCEKCNAPLSGASSQPAYSAPSAVAASLKKTVNEAVAFPEMPPAAGANTCPSCGYPMRPGVEVCPNCGRGETVSERPVDANPVAPTPRAGKGTVNPWVQVTPQAKCSLTPVAQAGEKEVPQAQQFKGESHELSRANLDAENMTITSRTQALLTNENGQWYIEDRSQQKTTFIHVGAKTPLKDGDIILMGNRQFVFKAE